MKHARVSLLFTVLLIAAGCRQQKTTTVIARVGDAELTLEEAKLHTDTTRGPLVHQLQDYATHWVNEELIYQEAKRKGIDNSENVRSRLEDVKRQLVNQSYVEQQIFSQDDSVSEQSLHAYFKNHSSEFFVHEDVMKLNTAVFTDRSKASAFAAALTRGGEWHSLAQQISQDTLTKGEVAFISNQYHTQHTLFPPELWKVASGLNVNDVTFPVKTSQGYYVLQLISRAKQGAQADIELVRDEIRRRILLERRQTKYSELLGTLRKRSNVEILVGNEPSRDTIKSGSNE